MRGLVAMMAAIMIQTGTVQGSRQILQAPAPAPAPVASLIPTSPANLYTLSATDAIALLCARNITATQYAQGLIDHYTSGGWSCINAFIGLNTTRVLQEAAAVDAKAAAGQSITPLCGLPLAVKDSIDCLPYPTSAATPALLGAYPQFEATLVTAYKNANGIIMGKANLVELSSTNTGINRDANGITNPLNAYAQDRIPGASIAARIAPWALCEDTGGSCRAPAIANGIFGFRPTLHCYNYTNALVPATFTRDTVGSMGRTAEDLIMLDSIVRTKNYSSTGEGMLPTAVNCSVTVNSNLSLSGLRIGLPSNYGWVYPGIDPSISAVVNAAVAKLTAAGAILVPFDSTPFDEANAAAEESVSYETGDAFSRYLYTHNYSISPLTVFQQINRPDLRPGYLNDLTIRDDTPLGSNEAWVRYLQTGRPNLTATWNATFQANNFDVIMYPGFALSIPPVDAAEPYNQLSNGSVVSAYPQTFFNEDAQAIVTALAFPIGFDSEGIPAGLQFAALPGQDSLILSLALAMEKLFGPLAPPPAVAGCSGCTAATRSIYPVAFNGTGQPNATATWSYFGLTFNGTCNSAFLTSYGQNGILGMGTNHTASSLSAAG
eukprot:jgi/Astpho2/9220/Aster-07177